jgi:hypothetical protein
LSRGGRVAFGVQFVQVPPEPVDLLGPLIDQAFAVIDQQLQLARLPIVRSDRQVRLAQRNPRHRQSIDRVGLARRAHRATLRGHQLRRHPHHLLTRGQQRPFQPGGQMPAVLDRPDPLGIAELLPGPAQQSGVAGIGGRSNELSLLLAHLINRDDRVRALVDVRAQNNHHEVVSSQVPTR